MPLHQPPKCLKVLALENIAKNIEFWCYKYKRDFPNGTPFVVGPFDCITPEDCQNIINDLAAKKVLKKHHIYLLVNPYLKQLNLNAVKDALPKIKLILELAIIRCQRLNKIILKHSNDFTNIFLPNLDVLGRLKELELPETRLTDHDVGMIALHAVNLEYLNIMETKCGNAGIKTLFMKLDPNGTEDESYGHCSKINRLDVRGTDITPECAAQIYSLAGGENHWLWFRVDKTFEVLLCLSEAQDVDSISHFKTDYLSYMPDIPSEQKLETFVQVALWLSPAASEICLWDLNIRDGPSIGEFRHLAKITNLTVDIRQGFEMPSVEEDLIFDKGLSPILWNHGQHLNFLMLTFVRNLDLGILVNQCTVLESLKLQYNVYSNTTTNFQIAQDWPLKTLILLCCAHPGAGVVFNSPDTQVLKLILAKATNIEKLVVSYCKTLVDEVFVESSMYNPFLFLTDLMITNCRYISMQALEESLLLKCDVPLENVLFFGCDEITRADFDRYKKYIERQKYKVQVDWQ